MKELNIKLPVIKSWCTPEFPLIILDASNEIHKFEKEPGFRVQFPITEYKVSPRYALIIIDSANVDHYFNFDGTYDGYSHDPGVDCATGIILN